jgi:hypothetical protein
MTGRRVTRLDELAQSLPPARDLWPGIAQAIQAEAAIESRSAPRRGSFWMPVAGMAAALALVAIGVLIGRGIAPDLAPRLAETSQPGGSGLFPTSLHDTAYLEQRDALLQEVDQRLQAMPAAEREKVAASLATLRRSIAEIEAALGRDPANALLQELLVSSCQEEMRALTAVRDSGRQET